jgi:hypothetical protein
MLMRLRPYIRRERNTLSQFHPDPVAAIEEAEKKAKKK